MKHMKPVFHQVVRHERIRRAWTQQELADKIGTTPLNVGRWERGRTLPHAYFRLKLSEVFEKSFYELGIAEDGTVEDDLSTRTIASISTGEALPLLWNVPYRRNIFFTGREDILGYLRTILLAEEHPIAISQPQAISGLGGIGKTQIAVEYAYRFRESYQAVLWARADAQDLLISDFLAIADLLKLPEREGQEQDAVVKAVIHWLDAHTDWLLILDNADRLDVVETFIPPAGKGHVLLTTRAHSTGTLAQRLEIEKMGLEEGTLFLLRRAQRLKGAAGLESVKPAIREQAQAIVAALDGLPLALDQAGAYIEEMECSLSDYLKYYQTRRRKLLRARGDENAGHPEPVATTWSLSFEKVMQASAAAAALLRLCAFLHPDEIPETLLMEGASELGPLLQPVAEDELALSAAIAELRRYSLIKREPESRALHIHRLVQAVVRDQMYVEEQKAEIERVARMLNLGFTEQPPSMTDIVAWPRHQMYLPHVQVCAGMITHWHISTIEAASLLNKAGTYLSERGRYDEAIQLIRPALAIRRQRLGEIHLNVAQSLNALAEAYDTQGKYSEAEPLYQQVLTIREQLLDPTHISIAHCLSNLAWLYRELGKYSQAEAYARRSIGICEQALEPALPQLAISLNSLGAIYYAQERYAEAEPLFQRALAMREQFMSDDSPEVASSLNNLATVYRFLGKYAESEHLLQRALASNEQMHGAMHPDVAYNLNNLAGLYLLQKRYEEAEPLLLRALSIRQQMLAPQHPSIATSLNALGRLYTGMGRFVEAERFLQQALTRREKVLGPAHLDVANTLENYAALLRKMKREQEAATLAARARDIRAQQV